jgi:hypothetical protein
MLSLPLRNTWIGHAKALDGQAKRIPCKTFLISTNVQLDPLDEPLAPHIDLRSSDESTIQGDVRDLDAIGPRSAVWISSAEDSY